MVVLASGIVTKSGKGENDGDDDDDDNGAPGSC